MWEIRATDFGFPIGYSGSEKTNSASISATMNFTPGQVTVLGITFDNTSATTPTVLGVGKPAGETAIWTRLAQVDSNQSGGGGGVRSEIWGILPTVNAQDLAVTITLTEAVTAKAWAQLQLLGGPGSPMTTRGSGGSTSASAINTTISQLTGTSPLAGNMMLVVRGQEGPDGVLVEDSGWSGRTGATSGQGSASNVCMALVAKVAPSASDESLAYTFSGDKGLAAVVFPSGPTPPVASFGGTGTLEAHKTRYPDIVKYTDTVAIYYRFHEDRDSLVIDESDPNAADQGNLGWWLKDESTYHRDQQVYPSNAGGAYTPGAPMKAGDYTFYLRQAPPSVVLEGLGQPGLGYGTLASPNRSINPAKSRYGSGSPNWHLGVRVKDQTMDLTGGGKYYPGETGPRRITVAAMVNLDSLPPAVGQSTLASASNGRWELTLTSDGRLRFWCHVGWSSYPYSNTADLMVVGPAPLELGRTYHVVAVMDGTTQAIYVNGGVHVSQSALWNNGTSDLTCELTFTSSSGGTNGGNRAWWEPGTGYLSIGSVWPGRIDEFAFWKTGLTSTQIANLATAAFVDYDSPGKAVADFMGRGKLTALAATYQLEVQATQPAAHYRLGEAPGATTMQDSSGNARHGSYIGSPTLGVPSLLDGDADTAMTAGSKTIRRGGEVPNATWMYGTSFTWECVFECPTGLTGGDDAILGGGYGNHLLTYYKDGEQLSWSIPVTSSSTGGPTAYNVARGVRHHVALVRSGGTFRMYVDGELRGLYAPFGLTVNAVDGTTPLTVGNTAGFIPSSQPQYTCLFPIDEVVIHTRALSSTDIANRYLALSLPAPAGGAGGASSLGGSGSLTAAGGVVAVDSVALSGSGSLTVSAGALYTGTATLTGAGALVAAGTMASTGFATRTGLGQLDTALDGVTVAEGTAALTGVGNLSAFRVIKGGRVPPGGVALDEDPMRRSFWGKGNP